MQKPVAYEDTRSITDPLDAAPGPRRLELVEATDHLEESADRDEHIAAVLRFRVAARIGMLAWIFYSGLAWVVDRWVFPGSLRDLLLLHACGLALTGLVHLRIRNRIPTRLEFAILDIFVYTTAAAVISLMCIRTGGLTSVYPPGISIVLVLRIATMGQQWRRALPVIGPALTYPVIQLAGAAYSPTIAAQLRDLHALGVFLANLTFIAGTAVFMLVAGNAIWKLRRQVFAARSIGRYRLTRRIGVGGMGEVWAARHPIMQRAVAIKVLQPHRRLHRLAIARFEREIRATSELTHPNTVRIFDSGITEDGLSYYVMELLEGENLTQLVARSGPLLPGRAAFLVRQAARALSEAHQRGIIHRDVKPDNLFVTCVGGEHDFVKVLDFGIARVLADDGTLTGTGVVGTPGYIAPEVLHGAEASARSDIYGLGAVLYFMISGHPPCEAADANPSHPRRTLVPPSVKRGKALPADLESIAMRCLARDPNARFGSTREMVEALDACAKLPAWTEAEAVATSNLSTAAGL